MPVLDAAFVGKLTLPDIWSGPIIPPEQPPSGPVDPGFSAPPNWGLFPTHPIVIPPGMIDGVHPEHPIVIPPPTPPPGVPTHPIVIPPEVWPPDARPEHPIVLPPPPITYPPVPTHPIVLPDPPTDGGEPAPPEVLKNWDVVAYWRPDSGWGTAIVPSPTNPGVPTPAKVAPAT